MAPVTIPILPGADLDRTAAFYAGLGLADQARYPEYLVVAGRPGIELHFWSNPGVDPATNDVACYIRFDTAADARALHDEWAAADLGGARLVAPAETDYGLLEFALVDLDGNLLRIGGRLGP